MLKGLQIVGAISLLNFWAQESFFLLGVFFLNFFVKFIQIFQTELSFFIRKTACI